MQAHETEADQERASLPLERFSPPLFTPKWLIFPESRRRIRLKVKDLAESTLAGSMEAFLAPGSYVWMVSDGKLHRLEVVYCHVDFEREGDFNVGFLRR